MTDKSTSQQIRDKYFAFFEKYPPEEWSKGILDSMCHSRTTATIRVNLGCRYIFINDNKLFFEMTNEHKDEVLQLYFGRRKDAEVKRFLEAEF